MKYQGEPRPEGSEGKVEHPLSEKKESYLPFGGGGKA